LMLMSYAPTAWPSRKVEHFGDNVIGELMNLDSAYVQAWKGKVAGLTGFTYWFNTQCPMGLSPDVRSLAVESRNVSEGIHRRVVSGS
ncbi:MAG: hypothetical protein O3C40_36785, partial [Planctomycetota bacterium]|nr:hypothetical protein [Planctomycetota bacterium]